MGSAARDLSVELAAWAVGPTLFLYFYVVHAGFPAAAIAPHVTLIASLWLLTVGLRLFALTLPCSVSCPRTALSLPGSIVLGCLITIYAVIAIGLMAISRVINWPLLATYMAQWSPTLEALEVHPALPVMGGVLATTLVLLMGTALWSGREWLNWVRDQRVLGSGLTIAIAASLLGGLLLARYLVFPPIHTKEPIAMALHPAAFQQGAMQNHSRGGDHLEVAEQAERLAYRKDQKPDRPHVILVVADALRADRVPGGGYSRDLMPRLRVLTATQPTLQSTGMRAACAESSCGLLAIASSRYLHSVPLRPITLAEVLKGHGYTTRMVLSGDHTNFFGLKDAYGPIDHYADGSTQTTRYVNDDRLVLDSARSLPGGVGETPQFLQFHFMSTHGLGLRLPDSKRYSPSQNYYRRLPGQNRDLKFRLQAINYYDNGVVQLDAILTELIEILRKKGLLDNALLIVTSDHGEQLGEQGIYAHANSVAEEALQIPFIMIGFGRDTKHVHTTTPSSQVDIPSTALAALRLPQPATWEGQAVQKPLERSRTTYFQQGDSTGSYQIHIDGRLRKYVRNWNSGEESVSELLNGMTRAVEKSAVPPKLLQAWRRSSVNQAAATSHED